MGDNWKTVYETIAGMELFSEKEKQKLYDKVLNDIWANVNMYDDEEEKPKRKTPAQLRKEHPSLQDAWEQYQLVLKLIRAGEDMQEETEE